MRSTEEQPVDEGETEGVDLVELYDEDAEDVHSPCAILEDARTKGRCNKFSWSSIQDEVQEADEVASNNCEVCTEPEISLLHGLLSSLMISSIAVGTDPIHDYTQYVMV